MSLHSLMLAREKTRTVKRPTVASDPQDNVGDGGMWRPGGPVEFAVQMADFSVSGLELRGMSLGRLEGAERVALMRPVEAAKLLPGDWTVLEDGAYELEKHSDSPVVWGLDVVALKRSNKDVTQDA